jgi:RHS repeat-associated protein
VKATQPGGILPDFQYAGLMWVGEVGLNASATRFLDTATTHWMTRDWIREAGGINGYGYNNGNPIMRVDPMGTSAETMDEGARTSFPIAVGSVAVVATLPWTLPAFAIVGGAFGVVGAVSLAQNWGNIDERDRILGGFAVGIGAGIAAGAGKLCPPETSLYRAVKPSELADILANNAFRNLGSAEGKYFTTSAAEAASYARQAEAAFGDPSYTIVRTQVPNSTFLGLTPVIVDRGITAWVIPNDRLPGLVPIFVK